MEKYCLDFLVINKAIDEDEMDLLINEINQLSIEMKNLSLPPMDYLVLRQTEQFVEILNILIEKSKFRLFQDFMNLAFYITYNTSDLFAKISIFLRLKPLWYQLISNHTHAFFQTIFDVYSQLDSIIHVIPKRIRNYQNTIQEFNQFAGELLCQSVYHHHYHLATRIIEQFGDALSYRNANYENILHIIFNRLNQSDDEVIKFLKVLLQSKLALELMVQTDKFGNRPVDLMIEQFSKLTEKKSSKHRKVDTAI